MSKYLAVAFLCFSLISGCTDSTQKSSSPTQPAATQTKDPNCLYVAESSVPKGMSFGDYKEKIKRETGAKCVLFTGG